MKIPECYELLKTRGEVIDHFTIRFILFSQDSESINILKC